MTAMGVGSGGSTAARCPDTFDISVILCTRNRAASLRETLASVSRLPVPPGKAVEMFVVDNGSTDGSAAVIREFRWAGVAVRRLHVAEPGIARSQNTAIGQARGRVLLFLDDDVRPPQDWLAQLSEPVLSGQADAVGGGIVIPEQVKPPWARPEHEEWLASTAHWERTREPVLVGANMAISRHVFAALGGFDEDLSFAPDTMYSYRLVAAEFRLVLRHDIVTEHHVEPFRFTRAGLTRQAAMRAEFHAFEMRHWSNWQPRFPRLRWLRARWRLARHRAGLVGPLTDENLALAEMRLIQEVAFWPAFIRRRNEPFRYAAEGAR
jgi:glycosyltransferase involved in cell wall biosynthesis